MSRTNWPARFLKLAADIGSWSKDPSKKVGCVLIGPDREIRSTGFNGLPRGIADTHERLHNRETKNLLIVHAERNAIDIAAKLGVSLKGCVLYVTFPPCTRCATSLIQAGIIKVVYPKGSVRAMSNWLEDITMAASLLREVGITISEV
jgi:dCMP deaminase